MEWHSGPLNCYILCSCLRTGFVGLRQFCLIFQAQYLLPRLGQAANSPVADDALLGVERIGQFANAARDCDGLFEYVHRPILITFVFTSTPT